MKDEDIHALFLSVLERSADNTPEVREVFSTLLRSTLKYRDDVLASEGVIVTVDDVRTALEWLVPSLSTGRLPETEKRIPLGLLKIWLDEFKRLGKTGVFMH